MINPVAQQQLKTEARQMRLVYTNDHMPGYTRQKKGGGFVFIGTDGQPIADEDVNSRIRALVLPPAWTNVWICTRENGHLQATGYDAAGRKQYRYHPLWSSQRNEHKHNRMCDFGKALPRIRSQVSRDLRKKSMTKEKVVALAISVLDKTYMRVGNAAYTRLYGSFGLTSLRDRHVKIQGSKVMIIFKGKKGVMQQIALTHARLARLIRKVRDIPGQELFQFYESDGSHKSIDSGDINNYLRDCTGTDFTAKDFRTWWGTVIAAGYLAEFEPFVSAAESKRNVNAALDMVSARLGNTRAVTRKYYVHPRLLSFYEEGQLDPYLDKIRRLRQKAGSEEVQQQGEERVIMNFIRKECTL